MGALQEATPDTSNLQEEVVVSGGDTITTFDELEQVENFSEIKKQMEANDSKGAKPKEKEKDDGSVRGEQKTKEKTEKEPEEKVAETTTEETQTEETYKTIEGKVGEEGFDLRSDMTFEVPVKGEMQQVSLQDLMSDYSGRTDWNKRYSSLDVERKEFNNQVTELNGFIKNLWEHVNSEEGNPLQALELVAERFGMDPIEFRKQIREKQNQRLEEFSNLSEAERKQLELEEEVQWLRNRQKVESERKTKAEQNSALENRMQTVQQKHGLTDADVVNIYDQLVQVDKVDANTVTPELIGEKANEINLLSMAIEELQSARPEMDENTLQEKIDSIADDLLKRPDLTREEIRHIMREVFGGEHIRKLSKKVEKINKISKVNKESKNPASEPMFFDDLY